MTKPHPTHLVHDAIEPPLWTVRFIVSLALSAVGVAWIVYYYAGARDLTGGTRGIGFISDLGGWNYLIGFALFFAGLIVAAHPSTPLGRGRGVLVGMLGSFGIGLIWIVLYYVFSNDLSPLWVLGDLGQKNLFVGIAAIATGFFYAMRWE